MLSEKARLIKRLQKKNNTGIVMEKILPTAVQKFWRFCSFSGSWMNRTGLQSFGAGFTRFPWMLTILAIFMLKNGAVMAENGPGSVAGLEISKSVDYSTAVTGELFTYTIQYRAASLTQNFTGVKITDLLPASVEYVSALGSQHTINWFSNSCKKDFHPKNTLLNLAGRATVFGCCGNPAKPLFLSCFESPP